MPCSLEMGSQSLALLRDLCADVRRDASGGAEWGESWVALQILCPEALSGAAEILDHKAITRLIARESHREFCLVEGRSSKQSYAVLPGFCTCPAYSQKVAHRAEWSVCKHELAVMLASSLGLVQSNEIDDREWADKFNLVLTLPVGD